MTFLSCYGIEWDGKKEKMEMSKNGIPKRERDTIEISEFVYYVFLYNILAFSFIEFCIAVYVVKWGMRNIYRIKKSAYNFWKI